MIKITNDLDSGLLTILILSHNIRIYRLVSIGFTDTLLEWFRSYLYGRTQFVQFKQFKFNSYNWCYWLLELLVFPRALSWGPFCLLSIYYLSIKYDLFYIEQ